MPNGIFSGVLVAALIGAGATLLLDLWSVFLRRAFKVPFPNLCLLGRWLRHMPEGKLAHANIANAPEKGHECAVGWIAHYAIGVVFALGFVALAPAGWLARPTLWPALLFGLATVVFPYLVMQPAYGLGVAAARTPNPTVARLKSLMSHGVFGVGLYLCAVAATADPIDRTTYACPLSPVVHGLPDGFPSNSGLTTWWYVNADRSIWAGHAATLQAGDAGNKMPWIRPQGTVLTVAARRLDADSPPARVDVPCCYGGRFQISGAVFPSAGCWEVSAQAGDSSLTFVTFVQPAPASDES